MRTYWGSEEFEDALSRALIALYETPLKPFDIHSRSGRRGSEHGTWESFFHCPRQWWKSLKKQEIWIPHPDRWCVLDESCSMIDLDLESLPHSFAVFQEGPNLRPDTSSDTPHANLVDYAGIWHHTKIPKMPHGRVPMAVGAHYQMRAFFLLNSGGVVAKDHYITIDASGKLHMARWISAPQRAFEDVIADKRAIFAALNAHIQFYNDRDWLFTVKAQDESGRVALSVYPEELKSLFYARTEPLTRTGRKAALLNWVSAHRRRLQSGIEIDIEKFLRGAQRFVWDGMEFQIFKGKKDPEKYGAFPEEARA